MAASTSTASTASTIGPVRRLVGRVWGRPLGRAAHLALGLVAPTSFAVVSALRVRDFTLENAYITFRYAQHFANGQGLVYNAGERVEGYTNFLWTVLLGIAIRFGATQSVQPRADDKRSCAKCGYSRRP